MLVIKVKKKNSNKKDILIHFFLLAFNEFGYIFLLTKSG